MPNDNRRIYWDACVVLSYFEEGYEERKAILDTLLDNSADQGSTVQIVSSVWSVVEVAYITSEKDSMTPSPEAEEAIRDFWDERVIRLSEIHQLLAEDARKIVRDSVFGKWGIKPKDAIHLATAQRLGVATFHTYDQRLLDCNGKFSFTITVPDLLYADKVRAPVDPDNVQGTLALEADPEDEIEIADDAAKPEQITPTQPNVDLTEPEQELHDELPVESIDPTLLAETPPRVPELSESRDP